MQRPKQATQPLYLLPLRVSLFGVILESVHEWEWPWVYSVDLGLSELVMSGVKEVCGETPATQPSDLTSNIKA